MERFDETAWFLKKSTEEIGISLNDEQIGIFISYLEHLKRWNQTINLTSITGDREIIIKHFIDSLSGLRAEMLVNNGSLLDIGTGAGFPGIPLKIVRPDLSLTLVEPVNKKVSFLRFIIGSFHLQKVSIFEGTLSQFLSSSWRDQLFDYVIARALRHDKIIMYLNQLLKKSGKALMYLSEPLDQRLLPSNLSTDHEFAFELPEKHGKRVISVITVQI